MIIDQLTAIESPQGADELPIERGQLTYKITWDDLAGGDISALKTDMQNVQSDIDDINTALGGKQDTLVSGTNIKTINGNSILGSGNIATGNAFTVTLASASWSNNAQTVSNALFLASGYFYIVSPASASYAAYSEAQIYADDVTTDGSMTFHCESAPSADLTVNVAMVVAS